MTVKDAATNSLLMFVAATCVVLIVKAIEPAPAARENVANSETTAAKTPTPAMRDGVRVYYLHGNTRCPTCRKIEAYTEEAVRSGFAGEWTAARLEWQAVNYERPGNEHFAKEYNLVSASVVLSRLKDGRQVAWKGLPQVWELTGSKAKFIAFVQSNIRDFLEGKEPQPPTPKETPQKPIPVPPEDSLPVPE